MAAPVKPSSFHAPSCRFSKDADAVDSARALLGFCVSAQFATKRTRASWAGLLDVSRSYLSEMATVPSRAFIAKLDSVLREPDSAPVVGRQPTPNEPAPRPPAPQRLQPRILDLFAQVTPGDIGGDSAEWLASYFEMLDDPRGEVSSSLPHLLRCEVVIARCQTPPANLDLLWDRRIRRSVEALLVLATGPYGCSVIATQRCAELGLLAPGPFFDEIERHLFSSAVGFRAVRALERFAHIWRHRAAVSGIASTTSSDIRERFVALLRQLAKASEAGEVIDPYPGAEWGITLARELLEHYGTSVAARHWLHNTACDEDRSVRERLYAAWLCLDRGFMDAQLMESLARSDSWLLSGWSKQFAAWSGRDPDDRILDLTGEFDKMRLLITEAVERSDIDAGLQEALASLIFSALVTPNGRLRRNLIEAVPAAGMVASVVRILVDIHTTTSDSGVRESILFFLSRLREPTAEVLDLIAQSIAQKSDPHIAQTALWAIGDTFSSESLRGTIDRNFPSLLISAASDATFTGRLSGVRVRMAAAHALAIIAPNLGAEEGKAVTRLADKLGNDVEVLRKDPVARLVQWGHQRLKNAPSVLEPVSLEIL